MSTCVNCTEDNHTTDEACIYLPAGSIDLNEVIKHPFERLTNSDQQLGYLMQRLEYLTSACEYLLDDNFDNKIARASVVRETSDSRGLLVMCQELLK